MRTLDTLIVALHRAGCKGFMTDSEYEALLEKAEARYGLWRQRALAPLFKARSKTLLDERLTSGGRALKELRISRELLELGVRERVRFYNEVASDPGRQEMLWPERLEVFKARILRSVEIHCIALKDASERDLSAAGDGSRLPGKAEYENLQSEILNVVDAELRVLAADGAAGRKPEPIAPLQKPLHPAIGSGDPLQRLRYFRDAIESQDNLIREGIAADSGYEIDECACRIIEKLLADLERDFPDLAVPFTPTKNPRAMRSPIRLARDSVHAKITELTTETTESHQPLRSFAPTEVKASDHLSIGEQIETLRLECGPELTYEKLAELAGLQVRQVFRHVKDGVVPQGRHLAAYNRVFSQRIGKTVVKP